MDFQKCNILHFLTHGHPWNRLASDLREKMLLIVFSITTENLVEFEEKHGKLSTAKVVGSVH